MKKIQSLLNNFEFLRLEVYGTGLTVYNTDTSEENCFDTKKEVIKYLNSLL